MNSAIDEQRATDAGVWMLVNVAWACSSKVTDCVQEMMPCRLC